MADNATLKKKGSNMAKFNQREMRYLTLRLIDIHNFALHAEGAKWDKANPAPPVPAPQWGATAPATLERRVHTGKLVSEETIRRLAKSTVAAGGKSIPVERLFESVSWRKHVAACRRSEKHWRDRNKALAPLRERLRTEQLRFTEKVRLSRFTADEALAYLEKVAKRYKYNPFVAAYPSC